MGAMPSKILFAAVTILILTSHLLCAQDSTATLSGTVTDSLGKALPNVQVSVKYVATGHISETQSDADGHYRVENLPAGQYELSTSAEGVGSATAKVVMAAGAPLILTLTLGQGQPPAGSLQNGPAPGTTQPSLEDLGFSKAETQANAQQQALLDRRTRLLKIHQRMGLITTIPMIASVVTSFGAGGKNESSSSRDLHVALGAVTGDLYGITAFYAFRAPRIKGTQKKGPIRFHEAMAWIHGPGMIMTPILGAIAFSQKNNGEKVHGIAQAHAPVAIVTAGAFGAALLAVSVKF